MYRCPNCGKEFEEPSIRITSYEDYFGIWYPDRHELILNICPYCGSEEIEDEEM